MKKSKTFVEAAVAGVAAVALVGLVYVGGNSKTVDLKATNTHTLTFDKSYSNRPASCGLTKLTDATFGLSNGGYIAVDLEGTENATNTKSSNWLFTASVNQGTESGSHSLFLSIDIYANHITSASFAAGTGSGSSSNYKTEISLFANNYTNHTSTESALKRSTTDMTITNDEEGATTANHVHYEISDTAAITTGFTLYFTSVSVSFSC